MLRLPFPALLLSAAALAAAGCSTQPKTPAADAPVAAAPAPVAPPPAPVVDTRPKGPPVTAPQVAQIVRNARGNADKMSSELVGRTVSAKVVPVKDSPEYFALRRTGDPVWFWCPGEAPPGGQLHALIVDVSLVADAKPQQAVVKLEHCGGATTASATTPSATAAAAASAAAAAPAAAPAAAAPPVASGGPAKPGMDAQGNVIDSSKVESGSGRTVKGLND